MAVRSRGSSRPRRRIRSRLPGEGRLIPPDEEGDLLDLWPPPPLEAGERLGSEILAELRADER
jgi:hypothetical protein